MTSSTLRALDVRTSRQLQQRRKVAQHPPTQSLTSIPYLPPLSPVLLAWCDLPLPEGDPLYEAALSAAAWIDVSDIARWKKLPPFEEDDDRTDPYSDGYLRFTHNLSKVVHGDRMRMQNERDVQRRSDFSWSRLEGGHGKFEGRSCGVVERLGAAVCILSRISYWSGTSKGHLQKHAALVYF
ncbi:hypothetical protein DFH08DRAFT_828080 [Mycena albidolilacea]|uniref:Uncharacterized protein n=1 Tax=Mycena albidolilacea TaxID=1033008 RepID=A0AAD6YWX7_9AGAR|nr:hypothetical protein DFH08DRAFT_828080 [Mycena albidolilacea]